MENIEALDATQEVVGDKPNTEETETKVEETETKAEETETKAEETETKAEETEPTISVDELDQLISEIIKEEDSKPIRPTFKEDEEDLSENDLKELDETLSTLEKEVEEKENLIKDINKQIEDLQSQLSEKDNTFNSTKADLDKLEEGLNKISEHPVIGPLAIKLVKGEKLDLPEYLQKKVEEEISEIPQINEIKTHSLPEKTITAKDKLLKARQTSYR